jgi:putative DNA methylase
MKAASQGTVREGNLVYELDGKIYITPIKTLRGDYRDADGNTGNKLRHWRKLDFKPRPDDVFQERLFCIHWITRESLNRPRKDTFFAAVTESDAERERKVEAIVAENLERWQKDGLVPDMAIESGDKTDEPIRTRGWMYWHHLFSPRDLLGLSTYSRHVRQEGGSQRRSSRLSQ